MTITNASGLKVRDHGNSTVAQADPSPRTIKPDWEATRDQITLVCFGSTNRGPRARHLPIDCGREKLPSLLTPGPGPSDR
ncbi:uncharacterized protein METZ01_LOCUS145453 [marine metagenome]|uniref:Uncharacterized protein n=1 Tax=marine metagenome TaxID=408172 RepID=A0A381ZTR8_9ZZZZ